jgi:thioredoxin-related protein
MEKAVIYSWKILLVLSLLAVPSLVCGQEVQWYRDLNAARNVAKNGNRPMVIDFGTVNCHWCKQLDATTLRDPRIVKLLAENFVAVKIDANKEPALAQSMGVTAFPTLIFARSDGTILGGHEGFVDVSRFHEQLLKAISQNNAKVAAVGPTVQCPSPKSDTPSAAKFVLPRAEELGVALTDRQQPSSRDADVDYGRVFARLRQIGAVGLHVERVGAGYRARIDLRGPANQTKSLVGQAPDEAGAIANALANADAAH